MGELSIYFFDTYAFFESLEGNVNYRPYKSTGIVTSRMNLMELHYGLLLQHGKEFADRVYEDFVDYTVEIDDETIKEATVFKLLHKGCGLSYIDCLGYVMAKRLNFKFLTGDRQFEDMENVEFVK